MRRSRWRALGVAIAALAAIAAVDVLARHAARREAAEAPGHGFLAARARAQDGKAKFDGSASFKVNCAFCHGKEGRGDGPASYLLWPKPRDFTKGLFKIHSTQSGDMPTDDDLLRTITDGMPGSSMLAWKWMPEDERRALVGEVKRLSVFTDEESGETRNFFETRGAGTPIVPPPEPAVTEKTTAHGKAVFFRAGCQKCHGGEGRGDGPSAPELKDDWGYATTPRDFTAGVFKGGSTNKDLYLRIAGGIGGTPMPSFGAGVMTDQERWELIHFVRSLTQRPADRPVVQALEGELVAKRVPVVPTLPEDPRWDAVPAKDVPLIQLFQKAKVAEAVSTRVAHDGKTIAILLEWSDGSANSEVLRVQDFRDGAAIQFAVKGPTTPLMGAPGQPVNIWHWKADWQSNLGVYQDVETAYPAMQTDMYPMTQGDQTASHGGKPPSALSTDPTFLTGTAAGNPLSALRRSSPVEDLNAIGFGTLTSQPRDGQNVRGSGALMGGRWRVVFTRELASQEENDAQLVPGTKATVSFAVWDGSARDRDGQKSVTTWYRMAVE